MKKLYFEYFKIENNEKITDKAMLGRVIITVAVILVCVFAMSFTAFAFFTSDATSSVNPIQAASFEVDTFVDSAPVDLIGTLDGEHIITLTVKDTSTATTGYCVVTIGNNQYITQQFVRGENGLNTITITVKLKNPTDVVIETRWGTSAVYAAVMQNNAPDNYIVDKGVIDLVPKTPASPPEENQAPDILENNEPIVENQEETPEQLEE